MAKIFHVIDEMEEKGHAYNQRYDDDKVMERAFKEGYEHGYKKAMRDLEDYNERGHKMANRVNYREGFEEKIERLKKKFE
jgi:flagellar biosynthesis/type III secretory pathway protein FliH